jgi:hypothetical protein
MKNDRCTALALRRGEIENRVQMQQSATTERKGLYY